MDNQNLKKFNVIFKSSRGEERYLDTVYDLGHLNGGGFTNCYKVMMDYIKKINPTYKVYYTRVWKQPDERYCVDVGSHSEFFYFEEVKE